MQTEVFVVDSKIEYNYHPDFYRKDILEQIYILARIFDLNPEMALHYLNKTQSVFNLPVGCHHQDGLFAVISPFGFREILKHNEKNIFDPTIYCESLYFLFKKIGERIPFSNYRNGILSPQFFSQTSRSLDGYSKLSYFQGESPIWLINSQLGFLRKGQPANTLLSSNEFGMSSAFAGSIILTHENFFSDQWNCLSGACCGDVFLLDNSVPTFFSNGSLLMYASHSLQNAYIKFGPMTFFV